MMPDVGREIADTVADTAGRLFGRVQEARDLPADLLESDAAFLAVFDAPGAEERDVQVRFTDNEVAVRVERFRPLYDDFDMRFPGRGLTLEGSVTLPPDASVEPENATATLQSEGTLHVRIPKTDA